MKVNKWFLLSLIGAVSVALPAVAYADTDTEAVVRYTDGGINFDPADPESGTTQLPTNIDFGSQTLQTAQAENLTATNQEGSTTTGGVAVSDNRETPTGWHVKVNQLAQFQNADSQSLENAALTIRTGSIYNNIGQQLSGAEQENQNHALTINEDLIILEAAAGEGKGETSLALAGFDLAVPANIKKVQLSMGPP
ncbi:WxL domain-containing protein [Enterococcus sp. LJL90]